MKDDKRFYRNLKKSIKKAGNRKRRQHLKRALTDNPSEAHETEFSFGRDSSACLNGMDESGTQRDR
jgi:hypothetical protein